MSFRKPNRRDDVYRAHAIHRADDDGALGHREKNHHFSVPADHMDVWRSMLARRQKDAHPEPLDPQDGRHH